MWERFKCSNVNFSLLKTIYVHLLVCYLDKRVYLCCANCHETKNCQQPHVQVSYTKFHPNWITNVESTDRNSLMGQCKEWFSVQ